MASVMAMWRQDSAVSELEVAKEKARQVSDTSTAASDSDRSLSPATSPTRGVPSSAVLSDDRSCGGYYRSGGIRATEAAAALPRAAAAPVVDIDGGVSSAAVTGPDTRGAWKWL